MKIVAAKTLAFALVAVIGLSIAVPAHADWDDGRHWRGEREYREHEYREHEEHRRHGYFYRPYYGYGAPVIVTPQPRVVYVQPQPYYYAPAPVGVSFGVNIR